MTLAEFPIIEFDSIDSTNNYAMRLIDADKAQPGLTIVAQSQTGGKGQRGKVWMDEPGQSLLMSIITAPTLTIREQFLFNATIAAAIVRVLQQNLPNADIHIKWPNDMIVNDKKAGGILIENVIRGSRWTHSVIGMGINVKQTIFPESLPFAISLELASGKEINIASLRDDLRLGVIEATLNPVSECMERYNELLYKKGRKQLFSNNEGEWEATILATHADGTLEVQLGDGARAFYHHGQVVWEWR